MSDNERRIKAASNERNKLFRTAVELARDTAPDGHRRLLSVLQSADVLGRLDCEDDYERGSHLRVWRVLDELGKNRATSARQLIASLTQSEVFLKEEARAERLITVCSCLRPPPPEVLKFWDEHSQPEDGFTPLTIDALGENGTEPALQLLEKKIADSAHAGGDKLGWLRNTVLAHRNAPLLLACCRRMLSAGMPEGLSGALVDVLFDYRAEEWFGTTLGPEPPDRTEVNAEANVLLDEIGRFVLGTLELSDNQQTAIKKTLALIGR